MPNPPTASTTVDTKSSVKETLISVVISFALAFVFRGFVVEAFLIPTGSMAPTLMGAHMRFTDPKNGYSWPVGPWEGLGSAEEPPQFQGGNPTGRGTTLPIRVRDPITFESLGEKTQVRTRAGDRIFVMKYLYSIYDPERFDVVVFKNPNNPQENYIKRLIGLPGEEIALVDGDVFVRKIPDGEKLEADTKTNSWLLPGWKIARKPELAQRAMWQLVFDSRYTPLTAAGERPYASPWIGQGAGWDIANKREYTYAGSGPTTLTWDIANRPIRDYYAYNEGPSGMKNARFPVSDIRISMGFKPKADGLSWSGVITARGHEFRGSVRPASGGGYEAAVEIRPVPPGDAGDTPWTTLAKKTTTALKPGTYVNLDFWHADQSLQLWIEDSLAVKGEYDWTIDERLTNTYTIGSEWKNVSMNTFDGLADPKIFKSPQVRVDFAGGAFELSRVSLSRDIFYQPDAALYGQAKSARATSPRAALFLNNQQFFVCGDNSPSSLDGRYWEMPDLWVAQLDPTQGVVNRDLLIGKAFFVYFPSPEWVKGIPVPDVGRMRFIW